MNKSEQVYAGLLPYARSLARCVLLPRVSGAHKNSSKYDQLSLLESSQTPQAAVSSSSNHRKPFVFTPTIYWVHVYPIRVHAIGADY